jgi:hypothetical protein
MTHSFIQEVSVKQHFENTFCTQWRFSEDDFTFYTHRNKGFLETLGKVFHAKNRFGFPQKNFSRSVKNQRFSRKSLGVLNSCWSPVSGENQSTLAYSVCVAPGSNSSVTFVFILISGSATGFPSNVSTTISKSFETTKIAYL